MNIDSVKAIAGRYGVSVKPETRKGSDGDTVFPVEGFNLQVKGKDEKGHNIVTAETFLAQAYLMNRDSEAVIRETVQALTQPKNTEQESDEGYTEYDYKNRHEDYLY